MIHTDQCPSTTKGDKRRPGKAELAGTTRTLMTTGGAGAPRVWRSAGELSDTPEFREFLEREFPAGASELERTTDGESRRDFLKLMGASLALAGAATIPGCRQPDHKILTYSKEVPEEIVPGKALYYATSMPLPGGGAEGLLVETHEGRPTKVEGNPLHPINRGRSSIWAQASVLGLYDPDRLKSPTYVNPVRGREGATWDDFKIWAARHFAQVDETKGDGLAFIASKRTSPTFEVVKARVLQRWPRATWVSYDALHTPGAARGTEIAFGAPMRERLHLDKAKVILSLDRDFLQTASWGEAGAMPNAREFASTRRPETSADDMSRLYVVESGFSVTGAQADHRLRVAPSRVGAFALAVARAILRDLPSAGKLFEAVRGAEQAPGADINEAFVNACADDLRRAREGRGALVVAGPSQPPEIHALAHAINAALDSIGSTVSLVPMSAEEAADSGAQLADLIKRLNAGAVGTVVCLNANPVYDAPGGAGDFAAAFAKAPNRVTLSVEATETADASTWTLNGAHYLEAWGDTESLDGTVSPIQPMIAPLYEPAMSDIELLSLLTMSRREIAASSVVPGAMTLDQARASFGLSADEAAHISKDLDAIGAILGDATRSEKTARDAARRAHPAVMKLSGYDIVRAAWKERLGEAGFDKAWRRALHDGVLAGSAPEGKAPDCDLGKVAGAVAAMPPPGPAPTKDALEVRFHASAAGDGCFAGNPWLQELPETGTRNVWDNPALMSPRTAAELGLTPDALTDKLPDGQLATFTLGGRSVTAPVWLLPGMAEHTVILTVGYGRRVSGLVGDGVGVDVNPLRPVGAMWARGLSVSAAAGEYPISSTQQHWSMEGRTAIVRAVDLPAFQKHHKEGSYAKHPIYGTRQAINFAERLGELSHTPPNISAYENPLNESKGDAKTGSAFSTRPQWGMTIDLSTCTGCGACTIACQAENNIPVVGKRETQKGRSMHWIRVDRYFTTFDTHAGQDEVIAEPDEMLHQPVACVHCENAPCETVCPVNATVHGPEGLNYMTYNRCIGTRYCANNCPYKVRRFNFFEYGKLKFNGDYLGRETLEKIAPERGGVTGSNAHNKININFIPPRLREKIDEIERMQKNPHVTVRMRGVMEKCTYCIQRINAARIETRLHDLANIPDGFFQVACQQACPSDSIVFGDLLDPESRVSKTVKSDRSYALLGYLNTRPRTSYLVKVRNPNPRLVSEERKHSWEDPFHHDHDHGHEHSPGEKTGGDHAFRVEPRRRREDSGYALSLNVLGGASGVHA